MSIIQSPVFEIRSPEEEDSVAISVSLAGDKKPIAITHRH
jgi:hypothetical protein